MSGEVCFYPVLPLDCLLCDWLAGRSCRSGWANDKRLLFSDVSREYKTGKATRLCWWKLLPDFWPDTSTINPYTHFATLDVFELPSPVYLFLCSALSSEHLPIIIDTMFRSPFLQQTDSTEFRPIDWAKIQAHLEDENPLTRIYKKWWQSTKPLRTCSAPPLFRLW